MTGKLSDNALGFLQSLSDGNSAESIVVKRLHELGFLADRTKVPRNLFYDIVLTKEGVDGKIESKTGEIKWDKMAEKTGNLAIETHNSKKNSPSGITATRADLWFHVLSPKEIWWCEVEALRTYIAENPPKRVIKGGGDDNADLLLYSKNTISTLFKVL